jgi:pilus assembly protein Flp/PilA
VLYIWAKLQTLGARLREERGATMVEYGLLVALIAILLIGAILYLSGALDGLFRDAGDAVTNRGG